MSKLFDIKKLEELNAQGFSQRKMAKELGASQTTIKYWLKNLGLKTAWGTIAHQKLMKGREGFTKNCEVCGGPCQYKYQKTCSRRCSWTLIQRKMIKDWLDGKISGGTWSGAATWVRRWLREQKGNCCELCGWKEVHPITGKVPLEVDHIDGHDNHRPENLRLLCPNCHSLTPNYRALNLGKGRSERKKYSLTVAQSVES